MNGRNLALLIALVACVCILTLAPLATAQSPSRGYISPSRGSSAFQSPLPTPPFCQPGQDPSTCLPWRPTPPPATPTPGSADVDQMRYVFLPLVLR